jgi:magnesium chelatase family protein
VLATVPSATLLGLDGRYIRVEVDVASGLPGFTIVGLADAALQEARERIRGALRNTGFAYPPRRITVNLAPADIRKAGASLDLAMAVGILLGSEQVRAGRGRIGLLGELSLGGEVQSVPGILPMVAAMARRGVRRVAVARSAALEASLVEGVEVVPVESLTDVVELVRSARSRSTPQVTPRVGLDGDGRPAGTPAAAAARPLAIDGRTPDLSDVRGQPGGRRALEIALAGGHGLMLIGPPGSGKTLLASTIPGLLPPLDDDAALSVTIVASAAGEGPMTGLVRRPPFRRPHHTASYAAMVGGGPRLSPGEITRADHGVLFLDELPEFSRDVLESLRQPLEEGRIAIARAGRATTFPARFQLIAAMNPCPCGFAGSDRPCPCPSGVVERYERKVSGPLRDRIDLWVEMPRVAPAAIVARAEPEASAPVAARIAAARVIAARRLSTADRWRVNGRLSGRALRAACALRPSAELHVVRLAELEEASGRGTERLLRVARTIADLAGDPVVIEAHLDEAAWFRAPGARRAAARAR